MFAIVTAGGTSKATDPLYQETGVAKKALIPLCGKPMIRWVIDAVYASGRVECFIIVGLSADELRLDGIPVVFLPSSGTLLDNVLAGLDAVNKMNPSSNYSLLCSSDIPLITPEIVSGFLDECSAIDGDIYYAVVEEKTMSTRFPHSNRTFVPFKDGRYSGGDVFLVENSVPQRGNIELIHGLTSHRKNYLKQAHILGYGFIIRFILRMLTVHETGDHVSQLAGVVGRVIDTKYAELGMDLDKPHQYEIIKNELEEKHAVNS